MSSNRAPLISVCIANYNGERLLEDCLDSILLQRAGDFDVEIIVHDDASTDGSLDVIARYPQVIIVESTANVGFCIANNRMAAKANGDYLLLLNNDAALLPDALATLLDHARQPGPKRILSLPQYDWKTGELVDRGYQLDMFHVPSPDLSTRARPKAFAIGACLWVSRKDWISLGGFPDWMESIGEDIFLCAHARIRGMRVEVGSISGYRHRQGASIGGNRISAFGLSTTYRRRYLSERNRAAVILTCTPGMAWAPWILFHCFALLIEGTAISLIKRSLSPWHRIYGATFAWLWNQRSLLMSERSKIQASRKIGLVRYLKHCYTFRPRKAILLLRHGTPNLK